MKTVSTFVISLLVFGFLFIALPEKSYSGVSPLGCCLESVNQCIGCGDLECAIRPSECSAIGGDGAIPNAVCDGDSGNCSTGEGFGCCVVFDGNCEDDIGIEPCDRGFNGEAWFRGTDCIDVPRCSEPPPTLAPEVTNVPTLSGWGFIISGCSTSSCWVRSFSG